jgi:hypothetical protein
MRYEHTNTVRDKRFRPYHKQSLGNDYVNYHLRHPPPLPIKYTKEVFIMEQAATLEIKIAIESAQENYPTKEPGPPEPSKWRSVERRWDRVNFCSFSLLTTSGQQRRGFAVS